MSEETSAGKPNGVTPLRWLALLVVVLSVGYFLVTREFPGRPAGISNSPGLGSNEEGVREGGPPSFVFVLIDTLRADYLGVYGFEGDVSPTIDRIATESIVFDNAFSQAPWTKPAIASLFTSLYPEQHGVIAHGGRYGHRGDTTLRASALPQRAVTLAERLRQAGYVTAAFVANPWIQRPLGFAQGFDVFDAKDSGNQIPASLILGKASAWLGQHDRSKPFFLYVHLMDVHGPYDAPRSDYDALLGSAGLGEARPLTDGEAKRRKGYLMRGGGTHGDDLALESWRASYAAGVRSVDRQLGVFFDEISRAGVLDDAVLIVTADHGEELADHGAWDHGGTLYEEQIRIPLVVRLPEVRSGRRVDRVVSLVDLMPTVLALAGASEPMGVQGEDLGPILAGGDLPGSGTAYSSGVKWRPGLRSVRTRDAKILESEGGRHLLFDLEADPGETVPASSVEKQEELERLLAAYARRLEHGLSFEPKAATMDRRTEQRLRALGYLDDGLSPPDGQRGMEAAPGKPGAKPQQE